MRTFAILLTLLVSAGPLPTTGQETASVAHYPDPKLLRSIEDPIADKIVVIRKNAGLERFKRVYRREARQFACTAAAEGGTTVGRAPSGSTGFLEFVVYLTDNPKMAKSEFEFMARYPHPERGGFNKFSVAAWPVSDAGHPAGTYAIAIMLFPRTGSNLVAEYFTDGFNYRHGWKKLVAPQCRDVK
jgi:hypothetical protein